MSEVEWSGGETTSNGDRPRVLAYSHDGYGLGHLRCNLRVIGGLVAVRPDARVLAVTGCRCADRFVYPPGVDYLRLPAMMKVADDRYVPDGLEMSAEDVIRLRAKIVVDAVDRFEPDLVLVDRHPLGLGRELADALLMARERRPSVRLVLGLRDILDAAPAVRSEWRRQGHTQTIERLYDSIMVYGSRAVYDPVRAYGFEPGIAAKVQFTGYLAHQGRLQPRYAIRRQLGLAPGSRLALCTLGGGKDGARVASAFIDAVSGLRADGWYGVLVTGPYMSEDDRARLVKKTNQAVVIRTFVADLPSHLAAADAVLCMGGYNTLCEALSVNAAAVVVPRVEPRIEQLIRAEAFAARGLVRFTHPDRLTPERIAAELRHASATDPGRRMRASEELGLGGIEQAASHLGQLLENAPSSVQAVLNT